MSATDYSELRLHIKAIECALKSHLDFTNEGERIRFLKEMRKTIPELASYALYSLVELMEEQKRLKELEVALLLRDAARMNNVVDLTPFLWAEPATVPNVMFPANCFGRYVLRRDRVVTMVQDCLASQSSQGLSRSVYLSGCRGSGKTCLLMILARSLRAEGYDVYFFDAASAIPQGTGLALKSLFKDATKKVAVLIDEVESNPQSEVFTPLLKGAYPHVVTIGAAVSRYDPTGITAVFRSALFMSDLAIKENDADFQELIQYCVGLNVASAELTRDICTYLLRQCGGHVYPTLAFIEYFTSIEAREHLRSMETFLRFFCGPVFAESSCYASVRWRCFHQLPDANTLKTAVRVLRGKEEPGDNSTLTRLGWWDPNPKDFISLFLVNACLSDVSIETDDVIYLEVSGDGESSEEMFRRNTERVIIAGLEAMDDSDFESPQGTTGVKVEDSLSFNWGYRAKSMVNNLYLHFQERGGRGRVGFYLDGLADTAIEMLRNATQPQTSKAPSQDIDERLERFLSGKYPWKRFALFNLSTEIVLPRDKSAHDKVYTYVHKTNTLYRGNVPIRRNVVIRRVEGSPPLSSPGIGLTKQFSTMVTAGPMLRRFMSTCFRKI